jgi:hypothetical protein
MSYSYSCVSISPVQMMRRVGKQRCTQRRQEVRCYYAAQLISSSRYEAAAGYHEHGNELSGVTKGGDFPDHLSGYQLFK